MRDMGIVLGSAEQAVPLIVGKDTVYVHSDIKQILEYDGRPVDNLFQYHEIQYDKGEYIRLTNEQLQQDNAALLVQVAELESAKQQLRQDYATLSLQLTEKGVL